MKSYIIFLASTLTILNNYTSQQEFPQQIVDIETRAFLTPQNLSRTTSNNIINNDDQEILLPKVSEIKLKDRNTQIPMCCFCCLLCYSCATSAILSTCDKTKQRNS